MSAERSNTLLGSLPRRERERFLPLCEPFEMELGAALCDVETPYRHAYFPTSGLIALVSGLNDHNPLQLALIGHDGMLGATLLLGTTRAPIRAIVHAQGIAMRITATKLQRYLRDSAALRRIMSRYLYLRIVELSLIGGCLRYHRIEERLARTLLLGHDRAGDESLQLTHTDLANMLGVRRSSITIAAGDLQERNLIRYTRGSITILDRPGLEKMSCECYDALLARRNC